MTNASAPLRAQPTVYWVTGLAGAGKTTVSRLLHAFLRGQGTPVVHLDGDELRRVLGAEAAHTAAERKGLAQTYARLCGLLQAQGISVVCSTVSMFHEVRDWNRANLSPYREIYLKVPVEVLKQRDQKKIYSSHASGQTSNVVGLDLVVEEPRAPDVVIENDGRSSPDEVCRRIISALAI